MKTACRDPFREFHLIPKSLLRFPRRNITASKKRFPGIHIDPKSFQFGRVGPLHRSNCALKEKRQTNKYHRTWNATNTSSKVCHCSLGFTSDFHSPPCKPCAALKKCSRSSDQRLQGRPCCRFPPRGLKCNIFSDQRPSSLLASCPARRNFRR